MTYSVEVPEDDIALIAALNDGDELVFQEIVDKHYASMLRIARLYVQDLLIAQEVVQETWVAVLRGIGRFEGRSSFKTWLFTILTNRAKTRATREGRYVPLIFDDDEDGEPSVLPEQFRPATHPVYPHHWAVGSMPQSWDDLPESRIMAQETYNLIIRAIEALPHNQQIVIRLRDVDGFSADEVCNILDISESNQRVLLHRARSRVRQRLESYFSER